MMTHVSQPGPSRSTMQNDSPSLLSWEGDKMFNIYIYDYCFKRGFRKTAQELLLEADIPPDSQPPINARQGLLFEWWSVFWVLFTAKASGNGSDDALAYTQHQINQASARARGSAPGGQPLPGTRVVNGISIPATRPFNPASGPMTNGVGPNPGSNFTPGSHMNGLPIPPGQSAPPNQPGQNFSQPPMPGQRQPLTGNPRGSAGGPGPFPSPTMANSSHNPGSGPHPPQPQPPMMNPLGQSPHLGPRTMQPPPPNGMPGAPGPYPNMNRPPSRTASPGQMGGMLSHRSPSLGPRQPPGMMDPRGQPDPLGGIPQNVINSLREEAGIPAKDVMNMNMDEKNRIANLWRSKQQRKPGGGPPNVGAGPSTMNMAPPPGRRTAGGKRNSTSPREDPDMNSGIGSPPNKKPRRSPESAPYPQPGSASGGQPGLAPPGPGGPGGPGPGPGQPPMGGMRPHMSGGPMNGFQPQPMGGQMGGGMGGPPPMGANGAPHMNAMSPSMGGMPNQQPGMMTPQMQPMNPGNRQPDGSMAYRSQVVNYTRTQIQASAGSPSDPSFGGGPSPNPFPGAAGPQGRLSGKPGAPPPSPGMNKDGLKDGGMASKVEDSPRNNMNLPSSAGMTPTASGTSSSTPAPGPPGPGNPLAGLNMNPPPSLQSSQNPTPNSQSVPPPPPPPSTMDSLGVGNQQMGGMNGGGLGADMPLFGDFMSDMAGLESFDPNIFRDSVGGVGGDLNFERDFGQWFNPNDQALEDSLDSMK